VRGCVLQPYWEWLQFASTVSEPVLPIGHEAIPPWGARVGAAAARARYRQRCPALRHIIFGPDNAYLLDQSCLRVWPGAEGAKQAGERIGGGSPSRRKAWPAAPAPSDARASREAQLEACTRGDHWVLNSKTVEFRGRSRFAEEKATSSPRKWLLDEEPCAVGGPMHVETFRNLRLLFCGRDSLAFRDNRCVQHTPCGATIPPNARGIT